MNRTIVAATTLACLALTAKADYIIKERFEHSGQVQQITLKIKEAKIRLDDGDSVSAVVDSATGLTTLLIHSNKAFLKISPDQVKEQTKALKEMLGQKLDNPADVQLKSTGKQEKINGFDTEEYTTTFNGIQMSMLSRSNIQTTKKSWKRSTRHRTGRRWMLFAACRFLPTNIRDCPCAPRKPSWDKKS